MIVGLLMVSHENDVLAETLANNLRHVDLFYALDGTVPNDESKAICEATGKLAGYLTDAELPRPPFPAKPVCGYRAWLLDAAIRDHGENHWFLVLHGDEWWDFDPREVVTADGPACLIVNLPLYFPREGEPWDDSLPPLRQLRWSLGPGFQEPRLFRGGPGVRYDPCQIWNAAPGGVKSIATTDLTVKHYLYRSPAVQRARAERHVRTGFDPDNYRHILNGDHVYWNDAMIARYRSQPFFADLRCDW